MSQSPLAALRRFVRPRSALVERCELCSAELAADHQHLVEPASRQLVCACEPCAILFSGQAGTKYKRVPRRIRALPNFQLTDAQWDDLMIPIQLAFFFNSSPAGRVVALYPSPAGPTESLLALDSWNEIVERNPILREMETDVEALLVKRVGGESEYYLVPVDECYKLVGLIRAHWRGLSGGTEVWREVGQFYASLKERSSPATERQRA
ncbi:MAG TPA: DUF5947 family protein [Pyrinomonadaceae bacterium]